jgi:hypothetical protein
MPSRPRSCRAGSGWPRSCWCSRPDRAARHGGHRRQDRRIGGQGGGQRALRHRDAGQRHQHHRPHLTGLFETAFQVIPGVGGLPSELTYEKNGLMFGNRLIRDTGNVVFQDPNFRTDLINYIHNCTMYDLIDGTLDPGTFSSSDDVWALMGTPNPARFTHGVCRRWRDDGGHLPKRLHEPEWPPAGTDHPHPGQAGLSAQPDPAEAAAAAAAIAGQIQQAYVKNSIATAAATAADIIRQNAVLNAIDDTGSIIGQKVNDPAAMVLAVGRAQAVAQQNATWLNYGKVAEQALPVFRNVIEAITYALFPLFVLLLLLTSGRETMMAFKGYAAILIWIQLWPPLYAVLNYMASIYAAYDLAAAADLGTAPRRCHCRPHRRSTRGRSRARPSWATWPSASRSSRGRRSSAWRTSAPPWSAGCLACRACCRGPRLCGCWQREHGQRGDGPVSAGTEPNVGVHELLAERPDGNTFSSSALTGSHGSQPAAQPGLCITGGFDARVRTGCDRGEPAGGCRAQRIGRRQHVERSAVLTEAFHPWPDQAALCARATGTRRAASSSGARPSIGLIRSPRALRTPLGCRNLRWPESLSAHLAISA